MVRTSLPSEKERDRRYTAIRQEMGRRGLECLIVTGYSGRWNMMNGNVRYLTNYGDNLSTSSHVIFPLEGEPTFLTQMMVKKSLATTSWVKDVRPFSTADAKVFEERLKQLRLEAGNIGLVGAAYRGGEVAGMPYNVYADMVRRLPAAKFTDATDILTNLRLVKSDEEVKLLKLSTEVCDAAFEKVLKYAKPGVKEYEWFAELQRIIYLNGAEQPFFIIGKSGPMPTKEAEFFKNDVVFTSRTLKRGDAIVSEFTPNVSGYMAQTLQLIYLGRPPRELRVMAECSLQVYKKLIKELRPGRKLRDIGEVAKKLGEDCRGELGDNVQSLDPIIHGVGLTAPEPFVKEEDGPSEGPAELKQGMVMMLELGPRARRPVYSWLGTPFVITDGAPRSLTRIPYEDRALAVAG